jgi:hypothetical protein
VRSCSGVPLIDIGPVGPVRLFVLWLWTSMGLSRHRGLGVMLGRMSTVANEAIKKGLRETIGWVLDKDRVIGKKRVSGRRHR